MVGKGHCHRVFNLPIYKDLSESIRELPDNFVNLEDGEELSRLLL